MRSLERDPMLRGRIERLMTIKEPPPRGTTASFFGQSFATAVFLSEAMRHSLGPERPCDHAFDAASTRCISRATPASAQTTIC